MIHLSVPDTVVRGSEVAIYEAIMHRTVELLFDRPGQLKTFSFFDRQGFVARLDLARIMDWVTWEGFWFILEAPKGRLISITW